MCEQRFGDLEVETMTYTELMEKKICGTIGLGALRSKSRQR